jgi:lysophospholipase L1-like esterase
MTQIWWFAFFILVSMVEYFVFYRTCGYSNALAGIMFWLWVFGVYNLILAVMFSHKKSQLVNARLVGVALCIAFIAGELVLRYATTKYMTYLEQNGSKHYASLYHLSDTSEADFYHILSPLTTYVDRKKEFSFSYPVNGIGLCERDLNASDTQYYRIACMGDSYTQGIGAPQDSSWPRQLENILNRYTAKPVQTINCGIGGSDLVHQYMLFKDRVVAYKPKAVVLCVNRSDIDDIVTRGGMERYISDSVIYTPGPLWWEPFFAQSFIIRAIAINMFKVNFFLLSPKAYEQQKNIALDKIKTALKQWYGFTQQQHINFYLALQPTPYDYYTPDDYPRLEKAVYESLPANRVINIKPQWGATINLQNLNQWYWPNDCHLKTNGYKYLAQTIAKTLIQDSSLVNIP